VEVAQDFAPLAQPHLWPLVPPGESLRGIVAATQSKTFSGSSFGVGITERRLMQSFDRKLQPKGAAAVALASVPTTGRSSS
jgi:hypothetical protein